MKSKTCLSKIPLDFWEAGFGFLCGATWCTLARNRVNDRDCEHGRKGKDLFCLEPGFQLRQKRTCSSYLQRMCVPWETLDTWTVGFRNLFYPTDPRNNDRLTHARKSAKKLSDFRKSLHVQRLGDVYVSQVWFVFWSAVILTIRGPRIWSTNFGDASGQRHVGGRCRGYAHGQVRTHGQTLLFYRYRLPYPLPRWSKDLLVENLQVAGGQLRNPPVHFRRDCIRRSTSIQYVQI